MLSVDPLNKQSTAMFGFGNTLPIAVAQNTPVKSMLSLNFEVEEGSTLKGQRLRNETISGTAQVLPDEHAHSGKKVLSVQPNGMPNASIEWDFNQTTNGKVEEFILGPGKYVFSAWVKADQPVEVSISEGGNPVATSVTQTNSNSIEGWKRVEFTFAIASATGTVKMNSLSGFKVDDLRIFPYNGNMKAFVYDPVSLKLVATLDENNYATYYIYDEEHQLVQVKRETEKGVITVKASKSNIGQ